MEQLLANILEFATEQGIWCALFVWLFLSNKKEASNREQALQNIIDKYNEKLEEISKTLEKINDKLKSLGL